MKIYINFVDCNIIDINPLVPSVGSIAALWAVMQWFNSSLGFYFALYVDLIVSVLSYGGGGVAISSFRHFSKILEFRNGENGEYFCSNIKEELNLSMLFLSRLKCFRPYLLEIWWLKCVS